VVTMEITVFRYVMPYCLVDRCQRIERVCSSGIASNLYAEGGVFESRSGHRLMFFVVFLALQEEG
jgi:hypothetical protein